MPLHCDAGELDLLLCEQLGGDLRWEARSRSGSASQVWRVQGRNGALYVKDLASRRAWRQELRGLLRLAPALRAADVAVPRVVAADRESCRLVLSEVEGVVAEDLSDPRWFRHAGEAVARIQRESVQDGDPLPLREAVLARMERWTQAGQGVVAPAVVEGVRARVGDAGAFEGVRRVWAHRDCVPRNWLLGAGGMGWIDFEHCTPDAPEADLVRVIATAPDPCRRAFLRGWGGRMDPSARARLEAMTALFALGTVVWARRRGDPTHEAAGRRLLERLDGLDPLGLDGELSWPGGGQTG